MQFGDENNQVASLKFLRNSTPVDVTLLVDEIMEFRLSTGAGSNTGGGG